MDAQRKKGILDVCVLAVLKKGPSYGYMIIRDISRCIEISESTLYPILKRLEQNGSLKTYRQEYNGRTRKYYELTETGQARIDVFLEEWEELQTMYHFVEEENARVPRSEEKAVEENQMTAQEMTETPGTENERNSDIAEDGMRGKEEASDSVNEELKTETDGSELNLTFQKAPEEENGKMEAEAVALTEEPGQRSDITDTRED